MARELEQVVGVAGLGGLNGQMFRKIVRREKMFAVAVAADDIGTVQRDAFPEKFRDVRVARVAGQFILPRRADHFGNLRVRVQSVQSVLAPRKRIENCLLVERFRRFQIIRVARDAVKIREHLVHAAEFRVERRLHFFHRQIVHTELHPVRHIRQHFERLRVAAKLAGIEQAGHDFMLRIPRRPDGLAVFHAINERFGKPGEITRMETGAHRVALALRQPGNKIIHAPLEFGVAGAGIHQRQRRKIMTEHRPALFAIRRIPATVRFGGRIQTDIFAEVKKKPVGVEAQQILLVPQHRVAKRPVEQPHLRKRKRLRLQRDRRFDIAARAPRDHRQPQENGDLLDFHMLILCLLAALIIRGRTKSVPYSRPMAYFAIMDARRPVKIMVNEFPADTD